MLKFTTKKYAFFASCALLSLLLLILSGCDATSDPRVYYQATGSWEGTIDGKSVRGIIAPDGSYQLAVVDANGAFIPGTGEYVGTVTIVDKDNNIGKMTITYLRPPAAGEPPVSAVIWDPGTFKLTDSSINSKDTLFNLSRTSEANGPAAQVDVAGRWSLSVNETIPDITNLVVDAVGGLSGNDSDACQYSGTLKLVDPDWNIFQLNLKFSDYLLNDCKDDTLLTYEGLAMALPVENNRKHLWLASNVWRASGTRTGTYIKNLAATINVAPVAKMTANAIELEESTQPVINVKKVSGTVKLDAQGSSDGNKDTLTYQWSVTAPDGITPVSIVATTEGVATFTPAEEGVFTLRLTTNDGLLDSAEIERKIQVVWVADRFVDCTNGTVLDTTTNLFWLKDAGCDELHYATPDYFWVNLATAKAKVATLASPVCGLNDGSVAMDWRLPKREVEFESIVVQNQWQEGDRFINVGKNPYAPVSIWIYWTSDEDEIGNYVNFGYQEPNPWFGFMSINNSNTVWPVRDEISAVPGEEVNACLQAVALP